MKNISTIPKAFDPAGISAMDPAMLRAFVRGFGDRREIFLKAFERFGSPLYIFDEDALSRRAEEFRAAFERSLPEAKYFYAMKSNSHPFLVGTLLKKGYGIDVSSGEELKTALDRGAPEIIFSGPAKTEEELRLAVGHAGRVTLLLDSFRELDMLGRIAGGEKVRAGVRLTTEERGMWKKFGIPLRELPRFFKQAEKYPFIDLCGLQFHTSWNLDPEKQITFLSRLGDVLRGMDAGARARIRFVDIGGGYWPKEGEWLHPENKDPGYQGLDLDLKVGLYHRCLPALPLSDFAAQLAGALRKHIFPCVNAGVYLEPGRWISHVSMHLLLQVLDKKGGDLVITDAGTNTVGWERFETDYFPVINMSRPSEVENPCLICGSLCTPHDIWGYAYFGGGIEPGDILVIPTQGAYTYSLRQNFIKSLPKEVILRGSSLSLWGR